MNIKDRFTFENFGSNSFMVFELNGEEKIDPTGVGMLSNNRIPGVLALNFSQMDDKRYFKYNITSRLSLTQFFAGPVNKKRLTAVFSSITNALASAEEYMLQPEYFILDNDLIFIDASTGTASMAYIPIENIKLEEKDFKEFVKNIMYSVQFDQNESGDYVLKLLSLLNGSSGFSIAGFKKLMDEISGTGQNRTSSSQVGRQPSQSAQQPPVQQTISQKPAQQQVIQQQNRQQTPPNSQFSGNGPMMNKPIVQQMAVSGSQTVPQGRAQAQPMPPNVGFEIPGMQGMNNSKAQEKPKKEKKPPKEKKPGLLGSLFSSKNKKDKKSAPAAPPVNVGNKGIENPAMNQPQEAPAAPPVFGNPMMQNPQQAPVMITSTSHPIGETVLLGVNGGGETTVLSNANNTAVPFLLRAANGEKVYLNKPVFRIGKEKNFVDYVCSGNNAISRTHVDFIARNGEYFIRDNNSTNGTYLNGTRLTSNQDVKIKHEDKIVLANEAFEFKLY